MQSNALIYVYVCAINVYKLKIQNMHLYLMNYSFNFECDRFKVNNFHINSMEIKSSAMKRR